ncbi:MAG TPA: hypothetical protein VLB27_08935, partial [candidate division Zixibacteria bacterium]|nr:hypothetical protein [candidate division Zixibacteria bacterium]
VDAFNGEGIAFAIASGQLAAEALVAVDGPAAGVYETRFRRQLYPELRWSLVTHRMYYRLPAFLLRRLWSDRGALERYTEVLEGSRTYKSYLGWLTRRVLVPGSRE